MAAAEAALQAAEAQSKTAAGAVPGWSSLTQLGEAAAAGTEGSPRRQGSKQAGLGKGSSQRLMVAAQEEGGSGQEESSAEEAGSDGNSKEGGERERAAAAERGRQAVAQNSSGNEAGQSSWNEEDVLLGLDAAGRGLGAAALLTFGNIAAAARFASNIRLRRLAARGHTLGMEAWSKTAPELRDLYRADLDALEANLQQARRVAASQLQNASRDEDPPYRGELGHGTYQEEQLGTYKYCRRLAVQLVDELIEREILSKVGRSEKELNVELRQWKKQHTRLRKRLGKKKGGGDGGAGAKAGMRSVPGDAEDNATNSLPEADGTPRVDAEVSLPVRDSGGTTEKGEEEENDSQSDSSGSDSDSSSAGSEAGGEREGGAGDERGEGETGEAAVEVVLEEKDEDDKEEQAAGGKESGNDEDDNFDSASDRDDSNVSGSGSESESDDDSGSGSDRAEAAPPKIKLSAGGVYALASDLVGDMVSEQIRHLLAEIGRERSLATALSRRLVLTAAAAAAGWYEGVVPLSLVPAFDEMVRRRAVADPSQLHAHSLRAKYFWRNRRDAEGGGAVGLFGAEEASTDESSSDGDDEDATKEATAVALSEAREALPRDGLLRAEYTRHEFGWWKQAAIAPLPLDDREVGEVSTVAISPDGRLLGAGTRAGGVAVWALPPPRPSPPRPIPASSTHDDDVALPLPPPSPPVLIRCMPAVAGGSPVLRLAWCSDGSELLTIDEAGVTRLWSLVSDAAALYPAAAAKAAEFWGMAAEHDVAEATRRRGAAPGVPPVLIEAMFMIYREWEAGGRGMLGGGGGVDSEPSGSPDDEASEQASREAGVQGAEKETGAEGGDRKSKEQSEAERSLPQAAAGGVVTAVDHATAGGGSKPKIGAGGAGGTNEAGYASATGGVRVSGKAERASAADAPAEGMLQPSEALLLTPAVVDATQALERAAAAKEAALVAMGGADAAAAMIAPLWAARPPAGSGIGAPQGGAQVPHLHLWVTHRQLFFPQLNTPDGRRDVTDGASAVAAAEAQSTIGKLRRAQDMERLRSAGPQRTSGGIDLAQLLPVACAFHPSFTLLGSQPCAVVALRGGVCVKMNRPGAERTVHAAPLGLGRPLAGEGGEPVAEPAGGSGAKAAAAARANRGGGRRGGAETERPACAPSLLSRELFVGHTGPVLAVGFLEHRGTMVTVGADGTLLFWPYRKEQRSPYGWFRPGREVIHGMVSRQLAVDLSTVSYPPLFPPQTLTVPSAPYPKSFLALLAKYEANVIAKLDLPAQPWRTLRLDVPERATRYTYYVGPGEVEGIGEEGGPFVSITRDDEGRLLRHTTATYKWRVTRGELAAVAFSPAGTELATLLYFDMSELKNKRRRGSAPSAQYGGLDGEGPQLRLQLLNLSTVKWSAGSALIPVSADLASPPQLKWGPCLDLPLSDYLFVLAENVIRIFSLGSFTMVRAIRPFGNSVYPPLDSIDASADGRHVAVGSSVAKRALVYSISLPSEEVGRARAEMHNHAAGLLRTRLGSARAYALPFEQRVRPREGFALGHESGGFPRTRVHIEQFMRRTVEALVARVGDGGEGQETGAADEAETMRKSSSRLESRSRHGVKTRRKIRPPRNSIGSDVEGGA